MSEAPPMPGPPPVGRAVAAASLGINVLALALPLALLQVFDRILPNQSESTLAVLFVALMLAAGLDFILRLARLSVLGDTGERYEMALTDAAMARLLAAEPGAVESVSGGAHLDRINAIGQLRDHYGGQGRLLALDLPFAVLFVAMIALIGGPLALAPLGSLCVLAMASAGLRLLQAPALAGREAGDRRRYSFLMETLGQIETVKVHAMEPRMMRRYERLQAQAEQASRRLIWASGLTQAVSAVLSQAGVAAMAATGGWLAVQGRLGMAEIAACMLLNGRAMQPMSRAVGLWVQHAHLRAAEARLAEFAALPAGLTTAPEDRARTLVGVVTFVDVGRGPSAGDGVRGVSFSVPSGDCLAMTGATGDEGSALLRMVAGEIEPRAGEVRIDGRPAQRFAHLRGRRGIVLVDGRPGMFEGTLLDNLSMFGDAAARDAGMAAARRIGLGDQIDRMPLGFDTPALSQGRQTGTMGFVQRIAIARALACDPRILLFDEANTALDMVADRQLLTALAELRGRTTLILFTRRPSYLTLAGRVVDLSLGAASQAVSVGEARDSAGAGEAARPAHDLGQENRAQMAGPNLAHAVKAAAPAGTPTASVQPLPTAKPVGARPRGPRPAPVAGAVRATSVAGRSWLAGSPASRDAMPVPAAAPGPRPVAPAPAAAPSAAKMPPAAASPTPRANLFFDTPGGDPRDAPHTAELDAWAKDLAAELSASIAPLHGGRALSGGSA